MLKIEKEHLPPFLSLFLLLSNSQVATVIRSIQDFFRELSLLKCLPSTVEKKWTLTANCGKQTSRHNLVWHKDRYSAEIVYSNRGLIFRLTSQNNINHDATKKNNATKYDVTFTCKVCDKVCPGFSLLDNIKNSDCRPADVIIESDYTNCKHVLRSRHTFQVDSEILWARHIYSNRQQNVSRQQHCMSNLITFPTIVESEEKVNVAFG